MKKFSIALAAFMVMVLSACGTLPGTTGTTSGTSGSGTTSGLGGLLGGIFNSTTGTSLLDLVVGGIKVDPAMLQGTWYYNGPGIAFTSENLLAKAGGAVAAGQIKEKLQSTYSRVGISSQNTYFVFGNDGRFQAKVDGIPLSGSYSYDGSSTITFKTLLFSFNGYVTRTSSGMSLNFEATKLLTILQSAAALSGNSTLGTIGELSKNYDGLRLGFDLRK